MANEILRLVDERHVRVLGLTGAPGSGKSTLARSVAEVRPGMVVVSMDDFYLPRAERDGEFRGPPDTYDVQGLVRAVGDLRAGRIPVALPRFDAAIDDRVAPVTVEAAPALVIVEGWYMFDEVRREIDLLVFLDVDLTVAKQRRFHREAQLNERGGGFTPSTMQRFWDEILAPGIAERTMPLRETADVVLAP